MKNLLFSAITAITLFAVSTTACSQNTVIVGSKKYVTKKVDNVENFSNLRVAGSPDVIYTQTTGKPSIELYASDNIISVIETIVEGNTLTVKFKKNTSIRDTGKCEIRVSGPALESATVQGSGDITFANGMKSDNFSLKVQGSGDIDSKGFTGQQLQIHVQGSGDVNVKDIKAANVSATVQGSGDINLSGEAQNAEFKVQGSGDISAASLKANNVTARVNGSGDISCHAVETLGGAVNGSGDVGYKGNPQISFSKKGLHKL